MNTPAIINFFAANGYLLSSEAISYIQAHDHKELLELFKEYNPDVLVIDLPGIRKIHKSKRTNAIIKYVDCFKQKPRFKIPWDPGMKILKRLVE